MSPATGSPPCPSASSTPGRTTGPAASTPSSTTHRRPASSGPTRRQPTDRITSWTSTQFDTGNYVAFGSGSVNAFGPDAVAGTVWNLPSGTTITAYLEWNDWNAARTGNQNHVDYDLRLVKWNGSGWAIVASALGNQCTSSLSPVEAISYTTNTNTNPYYGVVIERYTTGCTIVSAIGCSSTLSMDSFTTGVGADYAFWYRNTCNSLTIPADSSGAVATGATFHGEDATSTSALQPGPSPAWVRATPRVERTPAPRSTSRTWWRRTG